MALSLVPEAAGSTPAEGEREAPQVVIGKLDRRSIYAPVSSIEAAKQAANFYAVSHRFANWEYWGAVLDMVADNPGCVDDYLLKYQKAREQKAS